MRDTLVHRGPDDAGEYVEAPSGLGLGFRRLAIVDLSPLGHQPMESESGRYVIAFNGEVYNFGEMRAELEPLGHRFRGHSDTEVMLAAIEQWGLDAAVKRFVGMFGFALWDRKERTLSLVRDRLGIKPIYYAWTRTGFIFASELKALHAYPDFHGEIDPEAVTLYFQHTYIPAPLSIYKGVRKLMPGHVLTLRSPRDESAREYAFWSFADAVAAGQRNPFTGTDEEAVAELDSLLSTSVRLRMVSDVPIGAFLSGGIDSSTVTAHMQALSPRPIRTFSIGFDQERYNEAKFAGKVAEHLGTDHTELYVTSQDALDQIPKLPAMYDEPFGDNSAIPTYLLCALTRKYVTVSLSGDGGDELFAGYDRYATAESMWKRIGWIPQPVRAAASSAMSTIGAPMERGSSPSLSGRVRNKLYNASRMGAADAGVYYYAHGRVSDPVLVSARPPKIQEMEALQPPVPLGTGTELMMYRDTLQYLPDDILTKVDRASMAVSLEARVPIIDHRVVEFAWRLPLHMKARGETSKWILRQVLQKYVPLELVDRPKMGFGSPVGPWIRTELRDWTEDLLSARRLDQEGHLNTTFVRGLWQEHLSGVNHDFRLWHILMFQAWLAQEQSA
jgi:asparagine synthase (glutamine-hydrolysing)